MAWSKSTAAKHTCGGPVFGHKTPGCPRCDELLAGAAPVVQDWRPKRCGCGQPAQPGYLGTPVCRRCEYAQHVNGQRHRSGGCGPVCTFGEW